MKVSIFWGLGTILLCVVSGRVIAPRQDVAGVVQAVIWRRDQTRSVENDLSRRNALINRASSGPVALTLDNTPSKLLYYANSKSTPEKQNS
jgi:hypothetical protein